MSPPEEPINPWRIARFVLWLVPSICIFIFVTPERFPAFVVNAVFAIATLVIGSYLAVISFDTHQETIKSLRFSAWTIFLMELLLLVPGYQTIALADTYLGTIGVAALRVFTLLGDLPAKPVRQMFVGVFAGLLALIAALLIEGTLSLQEEQPSTYLALLIPPVLLITVYLPSSANGKNTSPQ